MRLRRFDDGNPVGVNRGVVAMAVNGNVIKGKIIPVKENLGIRVTVDVNPG